MSDGECANGNCDEEPRPGITERMEFKKLKIKRVKQSTASERKMKKSEMKAAGQQGGNKTTATDHLATQLMYEYGLPCSRSSGSAIQDCLDFNDAVHFLSTSTSTLCGLGSFFPPLSACWGSL